MLMSLFFLSLPKHDIVVSLSHILTLIRDDEERESCRVSCLQYHQLTGTRKGVWIDVSKLLVASEKSEKKKEGERDLISFLFFGNSSFAIVSPPVTHNLCIFVPLKASLATSLMPFLVSRLSLGREAKLQTSRCSRELSNSKLISTIKHLLCEDSLPSFLPLRYFCDWNLEAMWGKKNTHWFFCGDMHSGLCLRKRCLKHDDVVKTNILLNLLNLRLHAAASQVLLVQRLEKNQAWFSPKVIKKKPLKFANYTLLVWYAQNTKCRNDNLAFHIAMCCIIFCLCAVSRQPAQTAGG